MLIGIHERNRTINNRKVRKFINAIRTILKISFGYHIQHEKYIKESKKPNIAKRKKKIVKIELGRRFDSLCLKVRSYVHTSFCDVQPEIEDNSANIASEAGFIGAIDCDTARLAWLFTFLDHNDVVVHYSHTGNRLKMLQWYCRGSQRLQ